MLDWTRFRADPRFHQHGRIDHCRGCDQPGECQLYFVRVTGEHTAHPTYYCADCAMLAQANWTGTIEECVPARTEIRMLGFVFGAIARSCTLLSWVGDDATYQRDMIENDEYLNGLHEPAADA